MIEILLGAYVLSACIAVLYASFVVGSDGYYRHFTFWHVLAIGLLPGLNTVWALEGVYVFGQFLHWVATKSPGEDKY